jgi:hypothetical protein
MRAHSSVISPRGGRGRVEDLAEQGRAMARQRVSRVRLARRVTRRARWVAARLVPIGVLLAVLGAGGAAIGWLLTSPRFAITGGRRVRAGSLRRRSPLPASARTNLFRLDQARWWRGSRLPCAARRPARRFQPVTVAVEERRPHAGPRGPAA